jgi:hypothetical protein
MSPSPSNKRDNRFDFIFQGPFVGEDGGDGDEGGGGEEELSKAPPDDGWDVSRSFFFRRRFMKRIVRIRPMMI